jgi:hypothetical protein
MVQAAHTNFDTLQRRSVSGAHLMGDSVDTKTIRMLWRKGIIRVGKGRAGVKAGVHMWGKKQ